MTSALLVLIVLGLVSILVYQALTGIPPVPSTSAEIAIVVDLLRQAQIKADARIYELGCGWGSLVLGLSRAFPDASIVGIELSPIPFLVAKIRTRRNRRVEIRRRDYRRESIADADAVTTYLGINQMKRLAPMLDLALRPGTAVVTLCFSFRDRRPSATSPLAMLGGEAVLYLWPGEGVALNAIRELL